jgi:hypothetical protein
MNETFRIDRALEPGTYGLREVFADIGCCGVLRTIFADEREVEGVIENTAVLVVDHAHEMFVDNGDGSITIGLAHLRQAAREILYLDIIHELCHVKQHLQGRNLYDKSRAYVDRETEIEAYRVTVEEARRIGLDDQAISNYLRVSWITPDEHRRLACTLNVKSPSEMRAGVKAGLISCVVLMVGLFGLSAVHAQEFGIIRPLSQRAAAVIEQRNQFVTQVLAAYAIPHECGTQGTVVRIQMDGQWQNVTAIDIVPVVKEAGQHRQVVAHELLFYTANGILDLYSEMTIR